MVTARFAMSVADCVREMPSRPAMNKSRRTLLSASTVNSWCVPRPAELAPIGVPGPESVIGFSRGVLRTRGGACRARSPAAHPRRFSSASAFGAIITPQHPREEKRACAHRHVGDVERGPSHVAEADIDEIDDAFTPADA